MAITKVTGAMLGNYTGGSADDTVTAIKAAIDAGIAEQITPTSVQKTIS